MKKRYRLLRRRSRGNLYYCVDTKTGSRTSLHTAEEDAAEQIVLARNQAERQPCLNLQIAKAYLMGVDSRLSTRTWREALEAVTSLKRAATKARWQRVAKDRALLPLWPHVIIE